MFIILFLRQKCRHKKCHQSAEDLKKDNEIYCRRKFHYRQIINENAYLLFPSKLRNTEARSTILTTHKCIRDMIREFEE